MGHRAVTCNATLRPPRPDRAGWTRPSGGSFGFAGRHLASFRLRPAVLRVVPQQHPGRHPMHRCPTALPPHRWNVPQTRMQALTDLHAHVDLAATLAIGHRIDWGGDPSAPRSNVDAGRQPCKAHRVSQAAWASGLYSILEHQQADGRAIAHSGASRRSPRSSRRADGGGSDATSAPSLENDACVADGTPRRARSTAAVVESVFWRQAGVGRHCAGDRNPC